ncbi:MAG: hypothetical protein AAGG46_09550, partial [Planctomycetota bacterium]
MSPVKESDAYVLATERLAAGEYALVVQSLADAVCRYPNAGRLWEVLGKAHLALGDADQAVSCLEHASCLVPLTTQGRLALGHAYEFTGRKSLARDLFLMLTDQDDLATVALAPLARGLGRLDEPARALDVCAEAARREPDLPGPLLGMVFYQRRLGYSHERSLPLLFRALNLDPDD